MKIAVCSDLHLEFGDLELFNTDNADVLILSGDIMIAKDLQYRPEMDYGLYTTMNFGNLERRQKKALEYYDFIKRCVTEFPKVIMVMGNHEHYNGDYAKSFKQIKSTFAEFENFIPLDKDHVIIDNVVFFGGTVWTDMNNYDPITMSKIQRMMNDYNCVKNSEKSRNFTPEDSVSDHKKFLTKLTEVLAQNPNKEFVVVGHHAPSKQSTHPHYAEDFIVNGAYSSNLDEFIMKYPQIKLWTHGHTHHTFDYKIDECRIVCNPRGYINYEARADEFELKYVEI
jgi:predicted phosphodiesterase